MQNFSKMTQLEACIMCSNFQANRLQHQVALIKPVLCHHCTWIAVPVATGVILVVDRLPRFAVPKVIILDNDIIGWLTRGLRVSHEVRLFLQFQKLMIRATCHWWKAKEMKCWNATITTQWHERVEFSHIKAWRETKTTFYHRYIHWWHSWTGWETFREHLQWVRTRKT